MIHRTRVRLHDVTVTLALLAAAVAPVLLLLWVAL